jgi:hypothetical protein
MFPFPLFFSLHLKSILLASRKCKLNTAPQNTHKGMEMAEFERLISITPDSIYRSVYV